MAYIELIKNKKGISYRVYIRLKGYKPITKTFNTKTEAKEWASEVEVQMRKGNWSKVETKEEIKAVITLNDLITDFENNIAPKRYAHPKQYKVMYDWWRNKIGSLNLDDINSNVLTRCKNILASEPPDKPYKNHKTKSNSTIRKYMFALSAILRYGVRELQVIPQNPMGNIDKPKKNKGVVRFLSDDERKELLKACSEKSDTLYLFVLLAVFTGGRYSEILKLVVENIDFENEMIYFVETKNGENRGIPVYHRVMEKLKKHIEINNIQSGYVFINQKREKLAYLKGAFESVLKNTSITNFRFHDLRHTYASYLAQNGATLLEIATLMGHKNLAQVQIYAHLTKKHTAKVVRKMSANVWDFED